MVVEDLARLSPVEQYYAIYFWIGDVAVKDRPKFVLTLAGHCNALSREPTFYFPQIVAQDLSLVRVNYGAYGWPLQVVQNLAAAHPFTTQAIKLENIPWHGGVWLADGKDYPAFVPGSNNSFTYNRVIPLVSARWFIWQTLAQKNRSPGYYDFLGIKNRADYELIVGVNRKFADAGKRFDKIEVSVRSGVSDQMRNVVVRSAHDGTAYVTEDSEQAIKEKNPVRIVDRGFFKHEVEEHIGYLSNGLLASLLCSAAGERQDVAPGYLSDSLSPSNDKQIHVGVSCYRCHYRQWQDVHKRAVFGSAGLIDPTMHFRAIAGEFPTGSPDYKRIKEFEKTHLRHFHNQIVLSRLAHNVAVIECTGMPADIWALHLTQAFEEFDYGATLAEAGAMLGCTEKVAAQVVQASLKEYAHETGLLDPVLVLFARGGTIPRLQYHEVFGSLFATWQGMKHAKKSVPVKLVPAADADSSKLRQLLPKLPKLQLPSVRAPGLQQLHLSALCCAYLHGDIRTPHGGHRGERGLSAVDHYDGYGWGSYGSPVVSARRSRSGAAAGAADDFGAEIRPAAGGDGAAERHRGAVTAADAATRFDSQATLCSLSYRIKLQGLVADVHGRWDVQRHVARRHGHDDVPHQHQRSQAAHAAQWQFAV